MENNYLLDFLKEIKASVLVAYGLMFSFVISLENFSEKTYIANWIIKNIFQSIVILKFTDYVLIRFIIIFAIFIGFVLIINDVAEFFKFEPFIKSPSQVYEYLLKVIAWAFALEIVCHEILCVINNDISISEHIFLSFVGILFLIFAVPYISIILFKLVPKIYNAAGK